MPNALGGSLTHPAYNPGYWDKKVAGQPVKYERRFVHQGWRYRFGLTESKKVVCDRVSLAELMDLTTDCAYLPVAEKDVPKTLLANYRVFLRLRQESTKRLDKIRHLAKKK